MLNIRAFFRSVVAIGALGAATTFGNVAEATTYPTFTLDADQSSIAVTSGSCTSNCGVDAGFAASGPVDLTFDFQNQVIRLANFIEWTVTSGGLSANVYDIAVNLVFTAPDDQASNHSGSGVFFTVYGIISGGVLSWDTIAQRVDFDQGSSLRVWLESGVAIDYGDTVASDLIVKAKVLVPLDTPSPAPIPPALPVMLMALAGLFYLGRRQGKSGPAALA